LARHSAAYRDGFAPAFDRLPYRGEEILLAASGVFRRSVETG
jgi:hypothetical protein